MTLRTDSVRAVNSLDCDTPIFETFVKRFNILLERGDALTTVLDTLLNHNSQDDMTFLDGVKAAELSDRDSIAMYNSTDLFEAVEIVPIPFRDENTLDIVIKTFLQKLIQVGAISEAEVNTCFLNSQAQWRSSNRFFICINELGDLKIAIVKESGGKTVNINSFVNGKFEFKGGHWSILHRK